MAESEKKRQGTIGSWMVKSMWRRGVAFISKLRGGLTKHRYGKQQSAMYHSYGKEMGRLES